MTNDKLNGSVETLAYAFRDVFVQALSPLHEKIDGLGDRVDGLGDRVGGLEHEMGEMKVRMDALEKGLETTNKNMSAQFAAQAKYISEEIDKKLSRLGK